MRYLSLFLLFTFAAVSLKQDNLVDVEESVTGSSHHAEMFTVTGNTLDVGEDLMSTIASYAENIASSEGYREYFLTEEYNSLDEDYIVVNIVFEDIRYYCIMVDRNTLNVTKVYSCDITDRLLASWECNKEVSNE